MNEIKEADRIIDEMNNVTYEKVEMIRSKVEKVTSSVSEVRVQGSRRLHSREDALLLLAEMTKMLDEGMEQLKKIYSNTKDRNLRIYFDKKYFKIPNDKLELKYGIGKRQIQKICKNVEEKM